MTEMTNCCSVTRTAHQAAGEELQRERKGTLKTEAPLV